MKARLVSLLLVCCGLLAATATAAVPDLLSYQGRVSDAAGVLIGKDSPVNRTVTFKLYTAASGGTLLYAESQTVTISAGEFSVLLGNGSGVSGLPGRANPANPIVSLVSVLSGDIYLGVTVDDGTTAADPEIAPRQRIVSAAYAYRAQVAETVVNGALNTAMVADSAITTAKIAGASITNAKIAADAVTTANILSGSITSAKIADGSVTNAKIAANAITRDKILDGTINSDDVAVGGLNGGNIADGTIASIDIADGTIATADLGSGVVTTDKIANNAIDINKLAAAIQQALTPAGTIVAYGGDNPPAGWFMCAGGTVSRSTYSTLYSVIGNRFGHGDGSTTFHLPDLRGRFLRGRDAGAGRDDDRGSRGTMNPGGASGDAVGSVQDDQIRSHTHDYWDTYYSENGGSGPIYFTNGKGSGDTDGDNEPWQYQRTGFAAGGNETRPENAAVNYIIKY